MIRIEVDIAGTLMAFGPGFFSKKKIGEEWSGPMSQEQRAEIEQAEAAYLEMRRQWEADRQKAYREKESGQQEMNLHIDRIVA